MMTTGQKAKPHVVIIGTGGTIASSGAGAVDYHNYSVTSSVDDIVGQVPEASQFAKLSSIQAMNVDSSKIDNVLLLEIAEAVRTVVSDADTDGVVLTHGTDTLEETAFFLNLVINSDKPIVLVGAMRPAGSLSSDGQLNLFNAVLVAASAASRGKGVLVVANNHVFGARDIVKRDTTAIEALGGGKYGLLAEVSGASVTYLHASARLHTTASEFSSSPFETLPSVDIMYDHQGAGVHLYQAAIAAGVQAIVVAGMGNGSLSAGAKAGAELAAQSGVAFIRSSRTGQGIVSDLQSDEDFGIITSRSFSPPKARILALLGLASGKSGADLQAVFDRY